MDLGARRWSGGGGGRDVEWLVNGYMVCFVDDGNTVELDSVGSCTIL